MALNADGKSNLKYWLEINQEATEPLKGNGEKI